MKRFEPSPLTAHTEIPRELLGFTIKWTFCAIPPNLTGSNLSFYGLFLGFIIANHCSYFSQWHNEVPCGVTCMNMDSIFKNVTSIIHLAGVFHLKTSSFKNRPSSNQFIFLTLSEISYHILFLLEKRLISSHKSFGKVLIWLIKHAGNYPSKYTFLQKLCAPIQSFIFSKRRYQTPYFYNLISWKCITNFITHIF